MDPARPERRIRLSRGDGDPIAWSSDWTKLLIRRESPNQVRGGIREMDLVVLDADGTETRLTNAQAFVTGGSFSPDGSEVVYATTFSPKRSAIYAVSSDRGAPRLILRATRRVSIPEVGRSFLTDVYQPALSPDGTQIGYFDGMGDHSHTLWVMNADGTGRSLLLDHEGTGPGHMNALTWSPDGEWLAFQTDNRIYLVRPDGTGLRPVVEKGFFAAFAVQCSPDGSRIAYLCDGALSIVNVDGGDERIVEGNPARSIAWNPDVMRPSALPTVMVGMEALDHRMRRLSGTAPNVGAHKGRRGPDGPSPRPSPIAGLGVSQARFDGDSETRILSWRKSSLRSSKTEEIPRGVVGPQRPPWCSSQARRSPTSRPTRASIPRRCESESAKPRPTPARATSS